MASSRSMRASAKVPESCLRLRQFALNAEPHERLPSTAELCALLQISKGTLDEVLGRLEEQEVIYRQNGRGVFVSPALFRQTTAILFARGWLSAYGASPFWGMLLEQLTRAAEQRTERKNEHYVIYLLPATFSHSVPLPKEFMRHVEDKRIQGVVGITLEIKAAEWLMEQQVPFVTFAGCAPYEVTMDQEELIRLGVLRLIEQGCQRIGLWTREQKEVPSLFPLFKHLLLESGLPFDPSLVQGGFPENNSRNGTQQGSLLAKRVFGAASLPRPDGVVILDDMLTEGAIVTLQALGVHLGHDLRIATHGNAGSMALFDVIPGVSVIEFDTCELAGALFDLLDSLRAGLVPAEPSVHIKPSYRQASHLFTGDEVLSSL